MNSDLIGILTEDSNGFDNESFDDMDSQSYEDEWLDEAICMVAEGQDPYEVVDSLFLQIDEAVLGSIESEEE